MRAGDVLLLCSDGLTSMISEERIAQVLGSAESLDEAADSLIEEANEAGGRDNITVVLFRLEEVESADGASDQPTIVGSGRRTGPARCGGSAVGPAARLGAAAVRPRRSS